MSNEPLSSMQRFADALLVEAEWDSMAGAGACELAFLDGQLWHWADGQGEAEALLPSSFATWREAVDALASMGDQAAPISARDCLVRGAPEHGARLLAMAWSDQEALRRAARILQS